MRKIRLLRDGKRLKCTEPPFEGADHVVCEGACPECSITPFKIAGSNMHPSADDQAWEASAGCLACKAHVGTLRVETGTLFGVREDRAVLAGRCRVY